MRPEAKAKQGGLREEISPRARKHDPRVDPDSMRGASLAAPRVPMVEADDVPVDVSDAPAPAEAPEPRESSRPPEFTMGPQAAPNPGPAEPAQSRLSLIEPLVDRTAWKEIADKLGPSVEAGEASAEDTLIYAVARRESAGDEAAARATQLAISSMAKILGVAPESPLALVLAKRLLRKPPAASPAQKAPATPIVTWLIFAIVVGFAAGVLFAAPAANALRGLKLF